MRPPRSFVKNSIRQKNALDLIAIFSSENQIFQPRFLSKSLEIQTEGQNKSAFLDHALV